MTIFGMVVFAVYAAEIVIGLSAAGVLFYKLVLEC